MPIRLVDGWLDGGVVWGGGWFGAVLGVCMCEVAVDCGMDCWTCLIGLEGWESRICVGVSMSCVDLSGGCFVLDFSVSGLVL